MIAKTLAVAVMHNGYGRKHQEDACLIFNEIIPASPSEQTLSDESNRTEPVRATESIPGDVLERRGSSDHPLQLYAVADGMGGYGIGDLAARVALWSLQENIAIYQTRTGRKIMDFAELAERVSDDMDQSVRQQLTAWQGMPVGASVSWLMIENDAAYTMSMGQNRIYLFRHGRLYCMTQDHINRKHGNRPDLYYGFRPHESRMMPDNLNRLPLERGDVILLTSDGITLAVPDEAIEATFRSPDAFVNQVRKLIETALTAGGRDNMSAIAIRIQSVEDAKMVPEAGNQKLSAKKGYGAARPLSDRPSWIQRLRGRSGR